MQKSIDRNRTLNKSFAPTETNVHAGTTPHECTCPYVDTPTSQLSVRSRARMFNKCGVPHLPWTAPTRSNSASLSRCSFSIKSSARLHCKRFHVHDEVTAVVYKVMGRLSRSSLQVRTLILLTSCRHSLLLFEVCNQLLQCKVAV